MQLIFKDGQQWLARVSRPISPFLKAGFEKFFYSRFGTLCKNEWAIFTRWISFTRPLTSLLVYLPGALHQKVGAKLFAFSWTFLALFSQVWCGVKIWSMICQNCWRVCHMKRSQVQETLRGTGDVHFPTFKSNRLLLFSRVWMKLVWKLS